VNGKTDIDEILNPHSAAMDRHTYGWNGLCVSFWGKRLVRFTVGRLSADIYKGRLAQPFTAMGGGAPGIDRYWQLFWPLGQILWITRRAKKEATHE
jgi:hypothetical protein